MPKRPRSATLRPASGEFLRAKAVARKLGISERKVLRLYASGDLPGFKLGGTWLMARSSLEKLLRKLIERAERKI
jgi:excisionase family DNA binding protein